MAWTDLPATAWTDWAKASFFQQFIDAIVERRWACGIYPGFAVDLPIYGGHSDHVGLGMDCQARALFLAIQSAIEELVPHFVDSANNPSGFDGAAGIPLYTLPTWRAAAGLNAGGFQRGPSGAFHGLATAGDYVGPWLFNEWKAGLQKLVWTRHELTWSARGYANRRQGRSWAGDQAAAEAIYNGYISSIDMWPHAVAWHTSGGSRGTDAYLSRCFGYAMPAFTAPVYGSLTKAVDFYAGPASKHWNGGIFDSNGDDVLEGQFKLFDSQTFPALSIVKSDVRFGDSALTRPNWPPGPPSDTNDQGYVLLPSYSVGTGQYDGTSYAVAKWNVTNGFVYV